MEHLFYRFFLINIVLKLYALLDTITKKCNKTNFYKFPSEIFLKFLFLNIILLKVFLINNFIKK